MKHFTMIALLLFVCAKAFAVFSEGHWRWRKDNGSETRATWRASQDFPGTINDGGIRLRVEVYNGTGDNEVGAVGLQYLRGAGGVWTPVTDADSDADFTMAGFSPFVRDGQATTMQVNDPGAGAFAGGRILVSTYRFTDTLNAGMKKEYEWCIRPTGTYSPDSLYQFRITYDSARDGLLYGSPLPDMMIRPEVPIPGNEGIRQDPGIRRFFDRDSGWIASDGCNSIPLSDGRVLWTMDDSYVNSFDSLGGFMACLFQVRNCVLVQPYDNWYWPDTHTLIGDSPSIPSFFKNNPDNNYLVWPSAGYQGGDTIYVYCANIMNSSGGLGFTTGGNDFLAKVSFPSLVVVGFDSLRNFNGISFGQGFDTREPGPYVYTWGYGSAFITSNIYVARFPRSNPGGQWTFWNGSAWDTAVSHAAVIAQGASNGVSVAKVRNKFVLASTEFSVGCDAGTRIFTATSDNITGPFTAQKAIYTIPDDVLGHSPFFYGPVIHPEYIDDRNEVLITYDINGYGTCEPFCINNGADPDYYRPRGIRVPLDLIDSSFSRRDDGYAPGTHGFGGDDWKAIAYPVPSSSHFNISLSNFPDKAVNLLLYDAYGRCVYEERVGVSGGSLTHTIDLNGSLNKGVYFLLVQGSRSNKFLKVMLE